MSDLGAIFHVKKAGVQYDAHAYTTTDECPEPNLKIKFNGQQAYVKLEQGKGNGDVPCYAKDKAGVIYQVKKEAAPTGSFSLSLSGTGTALKYFTFPEGVKVVKVWASMERSIGSYGNVGNSDYGYIRVTPGKQYYLCLRHRNTKDGSILEVENLYGRMWLRGYPVNYNAEQKCIISWSPEINKVNASYTDY